MNIVHIKGVIKLPKILENVKENLINEGRKLLISGTYKDLNIRDIAKNCNISIGTFYNYFSTKDDLIHEILIADTNIMLDKMICLKDSKEPLKEKMHIIYSLFEMFIDKYISTFYEFTVVKGYRKSHYDNFKPIFQVISEILTIEKTKGNLKSSLDTYKLATFIVSNFIYTSENKNMSFDELYSCMQL